MNSTCVDVDFGACWICMFLKSTRNKRQTTQKYRQLGLFIIYQENPPWAEEPISILYWHCIESLHRLIRGLRWNVIPWSSVPKSERGHGNFCKIVVKCKWFKLIQGFPIVFDLHVHLYSKYVEIYVQ